MTVIFKQTLAELRPDDVRFILANLPQMENPDQKPADAAQDHSALRIKDCDERDDEGRRRRHIDREWPEVGAILSADYYGSAYTAEIIPASKRLKSGKQIRITSGPARGTVSDSFSDAMISATEAQRTQQNLGRKGVSNGWLFWDWPGKPKNIAGDPADDATDD